jgi:hypothetical protein
MRMSGLGRGNSVLVPMSTNLTVQAFKVWLGECREAGDC